MATGVDFDADRKMRSRQVKPSVLPVASTRRFTAAPEEKLLSDSTVLRISTALHSSLHTADIMRSFAGEARRLLPKLSVRYCNKHHEVTIEDGAHFQHRTSYELNLVGDYLGEISFYRQCAFTEKEESLIELLLCALIYPLRNSLLYQQALTQALKDPLTGVNNRASMNAYIKQQVLLAQRHKTELSVIMLDIDRFKSINDTYGHLVGDRVLQRIANALIKCTRDSDVVFRFGGEEFVVVLSNTDKWGAYLLAERIRATVEQLEIDSIGKESITVSGGVEACQPHDDALSLISRCDELLYQAKSCGRNCVLIKKR
ncbi:MAG: GGDEF domain-containing protein [Gammaproteobacteria bacterium]